MAHAGEAALRAQLAKAQAAMRALTDRWRGKRRCTERPTLQAAVEAIMTRDRVQGLLAVRYTERVQKCPLRRYGSRPAMVGGSVTSA